MFRAFSLGVLGLGMILATFSHSTNYGLQNYSIGPGATDTTHSTTYYAQGTVGEQANGKSSGSTKTANNGSVQTEQLNIPPAPTLSNGSNTYYNMLGLIIATGGNPTDTTYAVAISTNNFTTTNYVQANGTIGGSAVYQTYTAWGGASGSDIIDLSPSTSYEVKVAAKEGQFTNTEYGAYASASTVSPSTTFSITPNSLTLSSLLPGSVITSSAMSIGFATNADSGGAVYVSGARAGLFSTTQNYLIPAYSGNLAGQSQGFGVQASGPTQTSGGPLADVSPFNGSGNSVGAESTTPNQILTTTAPIVGGSASANVQAKSASTTPATADYTETLTFIATGNF